ncbi:MAG: aminotransferase class IV [Oscillospiraceae bacterium]|nr:aminotransferase class IV [Oscillospiraceae bacterium]
MKNLGYYNGKFGEIEEMTIPMSDRVCFFGDGVYDATYSRNYKIFSIDDHVNRFFSSAKLLEINLPVTKEELKDTLYDMVKKMDTGENFVYFQATRGSGVRNHLFPESGKANLWINIFHREIVDVYKKVKLITMEDTRFLHCNIKTLNLIPAVIASQRAKEAGCDETVFHRGDRVTECAHSNVHIIKDGTFITAPTDNLILPGIARSHIIRACKKLGIPVSETPYTVDELMAADEIMISSAGSLCLAADKIDGKFVGGKAPDILSKIQDEVLREFMEETN